MGTSNVNWKATFTAGEALNTVGHEGVAIALADGKVANLGDEATGILYDKPANGQHGSMIILGIGKGRAGTGLTKGNRLTVTLSGYFTEAASDSYHVGRAWESITSGSLGPIMFHGTGFYQVSSK
jgi:hypothetical protein